VDETRLRALFPRTREPVATLTTLERALGRRPSFEDVVRALTEAFEEEHGLRLKPEGLSREEVQSSERLVRDKYGTDAWLWGEQTARRRESSPSRPDPASPSRLP
jgi:lipoate-protein ligase A